MAEDRKIYSPIAKTLHKATHLPFGTYGLIGAGSGLANVLLNKKLHLDDLDEKDRRKAILRQILLGGLAGLGVDTAIKGGRTFATKPDISEYTDGPFLEVHRE